MAMRSGGESLVERLRGMYAFAIWDTRKKEIICSKGYFRNQTAVLCTDERNVYVWIRDQGVYGTSKI